MDLISLSVFFSERKFRRVHYFLKELGSPSTRLVKKSSPKNVRVLVLLLFGSKSVAGAELEGISEAERV